MPAPSKRALIDGAWRIPNGIDAGAGDILQYKGELLGQVADLFDDLESTLANSRIRFFNTWNEPAFQHRGDDGAPPAIPLAATSPPADEVDARHPESGGNGSETTKIDLNTASSAELATYRLKPLDSSSVARTASHTSSPMQVKKLDSSGYSAVARTASHSSSPIQEAPDECKFEADPNLATMSGGSATHQVVKQNTVELLDDLLLRTKLVGQFEGPDTKKGHRLTRTAQKLTAKYYVTSGTFELVSASVIIMNAMVMAFEVQCNSFDDGYAIGYPGQNMRSTEVWPGAEKVFYVLEFVFGVTFTLELLIKLATLRLDFYKTPWNLIDVLVVLCWFVTLVYDSYMPFNPTLFRLMRILKLIRLAKMFKTIQVFDSLQVLVGSIKACCSALVWSCFLLLLIQTLFAFVFNTLLQSFVLDENQTDADRFEIYELFGSFSKAMMSMTELTLGNWVPICRLLYEKVAQSYGFVVLGYVITVNFAIVRVITGVFLQTTFQVAAMDDDLMVVQKIRAATSHKQKMMRLLQETDLDRKGYIDREDFMYALHNSKLRQWLAAMDLEVNDADLVFEFLDDGDGMLTYDELINGVSRLKGAARAIDVVLINRRTLQLGFLCKNIIKRLDRLDQSKRI